MSKHYSNLELIVKECKAGIKSGNTLWHAMVMRAEVEFARSGDGEQESKRVRDLFKGDEDAAKNEHKVSLNDHGAYRSNKSVIGSAIKLGVALRNAAGVPRGKTEVEKEIKGLKEAESPLETIKKSALLQSKKLKQMREEGCTSYAANLAFATIKAAYDEASKLAGDLLKQAA